MTQNTPMIFGIRRSAFIETILFLLAFCVVDGLAFSGERFFSVYPHPFWIVVLIISVQYGTGAGIFAAIAASVALLFGNMPEQNIQQDMYEYLLFVAARPLMWVTAAVIIGELRERHVRERDSLRKQLLETQEREEEIAGSYDRVYNIKENLEARIAGQLRSSIAAYSAAKAIDKLRPSEVILGIEDLISSIMSPKQFSVFLLKNQKLDSIIHYGWNADSDYSSSFSADAPIFHETIGRQRILCAVNADDEKILAGEGVLAGAIRNPETGEVVGIIKIEDIGFTSLNLTSVEEFRVLCEWIGLCYDNAVRYEQAEADSVVDYETSLYSSGFFERQTAYLTELGRRVGFDVSLLAVKLTNASELTEEEYFSAANVLNDVVKANLRSIDQVFDHQRDNANFAILLPNTPAKNAQVVVDKIKNTIQKSIRTAAPNARFSYTSHALFEVKKGSKATTPRASA